MVQLYDIAKPRDERMILDYSGLVQLTPNYKLPASKYLCKMEKTGMLKTGQSKQ